MSKIIAFLKKEPMLTVSVLAAAASLWITPPSRALLSAIDWRTLGTLFMMLTVLEGFKKENILPLFYVSAGGCAERLRSRCFWSFRSFSVLCS